MIKKLWEGLLFTNILGHNEKVRNEILKDNRKAAIFWAVIQIIFWSFSLVMSRFNAEYTECLPIYIVTIGISVGALICSLFVCPKHDRCQKRSFFCISGISVKS